MHFLDIEGELPPASEQVLTALLRYGPRFGGEETQPAGATDPTPTELLLVVPRPGTISPWSSKATDIAHICGLSQVRRLTGASAEEED